MGIMDYIETAREAVINRGNQNPSYTERLDFSNGQVSDNDNAFNQYEDEIQEIFEHLLRDDMSESEMKSLEESIRGLDSEEKMNILAEIEENKSIQKENRNAQIRSRAQRPTLGPTMQR